MPIALAPERILCSDIQHQSNSAVKPKAPGPAELIRITYPIPSCRQVTPPKDIQSLLRVYNYWARKLRGAFQYGWLKLH